MEIWKPVVEYEGSYEVSNIGNIRSLKSGKKLVPVYMPSGYRIVCLRQKTKRICRLVLSSFGGLPPSPRHQCNHIDGKKENDNINNLEWTTPSENQRHAMYKLKTHAWRHLVKDIAIDDEVKSMSEWCREKGISLNTFRGRLKWGWDAKKALNTPTRRYGKP